MRKMSSDQILFNAIPERNNSKEKRNLIGKEMFINSILLKFSSYHQIKDQDMSYSDGTKDKYSKFSSITSFTNVEDKEIGKENKKIAAYNRNFETCENDANKEDTVANRNINSRYLIIPFKNENLHRGVLCELLKSEKEVTILSPDIQNINKGQEIAEAFAKAPMMISPAAKRRLATRKREMDTELENSRSDERGDEPDHLRQLFCYLVRMGSFNSSPKINNTDSQDDDLQVPQGLTTVDLLEHCRAMRGESHPKLLNRLFIKPLTDTSILSNNISKGLRVLKLNAISKVCSAPITLPNHLRILQWNILSQSLGQNNDGFINCPEEALAWENRKYLIVEEILRNNPDIICLQEVDHFKFLNRILGSQNFNGMFFPKPDSPCLYIQKNNGPDGCAIFYKSDKFDLVDFKTRVLQVWKVQSNQVAIAARLKNLETGNEICICTTHLKARNGALLAKLRNEQGKDLLRFISSFSNGTPVILCGDFNAEPNEPVYSTVLNFKTLRLSSAYADMLDIEKGSELFKINNKNDLLNLDNIAENRRLSLTLRANREPPYTTWKIREDGEVCHTIDYIFYSSKKLKVTNCLSLPREKEIGENRTPSFQYPSDHFSLVCDFELIEKVGKSLPTK